MGPCDEPKACAIQKETGLDRMSKSHWVERSEHRTHHHFSTIDHTRSISLGRSQKHEEVETNQISISGESLEAGLQSEATLWLWLEPKVRVIWRLLAVPSLHATGYESESDLNQSDHQPLLAVPYNLSLELYSFTCFNKTSASPPFATYHFGST